MKNRIGNFCWGGVFLFCILIVALPSTRMIFIEATEQHPYGAGFVKFFLLATMGDLLGVRIGKGEWIIPKGIGLKACLWGILGMAITLMFPVFMSGAAGAQAMGKLPFEGSKAAQAFFGSVLMNVTFGPMLYIYHKFGDLCIEWQYEHPDKKINGNDLVEKVDWQTMVNFFWLKTCLIVWIPCHTVVFLLPSEYRVLASAFLSVLLGILVALSKKNQNAVQPGSRSTTFGYQHGL